VLLLLFGASACGDEPGPEPAMVTTTTNPVPVEQRAKALLDELARSGDRPAMFDHRYVAKLDGGRSVLFVATADDLGIAYFCDPSAEPSWMIGSADHGQLQLVAKDGSSFQGGVVVGKLSGLLEHPAAGRRSVALREASGISIAPGPDVSGRCRVHP
jgi:hypothetical protein